MLFFIYNKDSCIIPGFGGASSPVSFSTRTVENGCSPSDLTDQEVDHLRTELAKVMHHNVGREVVYCPSLLPPHPPTPTGVMLHRWRRKSTRCGRSSWPRRRTRRTSGGSWVWVPSVTSNRTWLRAGTTCRARPRECEHSDRNQEIARLRNSAGDDHLCSPCRYLSASATLEDIGQSDM